MAVAVVVVGNRDGGGGGSGGECGSIPPPACNFQPSSLSHRLTHN
jgi:hypothetical protein